MTRVCRAALNHLGRIGAARSELGLHPVFDTRRVSFARNLEMNWRTIRSELDSVLTEPHKIPGFQEISPDQSHLTRDDHWKTFFLFAFGYRSDRNCARCPETSRLIAEIPGLTTAFFSILKAGARLPAHRGVYSGLLRYHLGLRVPEPTEKTAMRVGNRTVHWREGESILFDDSFEHEAWNDTDALRAVLIVDVLRPLPMPWSLLNRGIVSLISRTPLVQEGRRNFEQWHERANQRVPTGA